MEGLLAMKKKNLIKKLIIWCLIIGIIAGGVFFLISRGNKDQEKIVLEEVPVFSVYLPTGDTTTESDILSVERDINNILLVECNCAVKFYMAPESRYQTMLESAKKVITAYNENKSLASPLPFSYSFDYATSTFDYKCDETVEEKYVVYNSDTVIELLDDGVEIYPNAPSIDIALFTNYSDYYDAYKNGEIVRLDTALSAEIKELKQSIPAALFSALTTEANNMGIYGIPTVRPIGDYEYMVFDKDLLDKYSVDKNQMLDLEDLESYLETVYAGEAGAVTPLLNPPSTMYSEMYNEKHSIGVTDNGAMYFAYTDAAFQKYYTTISRYRSLGYMGEGDANMDDASFAVAFFKGSQAELEAYIENSDKNLVFNGGDDGSKPFAYPVATDTEVGEAVFSIFNTPYSYYGAASSTTLSDSQKRAVDFLRILNKKSASVKNILLYGAPSIHYTLSDTDNSVIFVKDNTYSMKNYHTGNAFHALVCNEEGYNVTEQWIADGMAHNLGLINTKFSGFHLDAASFVVNDGGETIFIEGIDYLAIIDQICDKYYEDYLNGTIGMIDINAFNESAAVQIRQSIIDSIVGERQDEFEAAKTEEYRQEILNNPSALQSLIAAATGSVDVDIQEDAKKLLEEELRKKYEPFGYTEEEITNKLAVDLTDDAINAYIEENYDDKKRQEFIDKKVYGDEEKGVVGTLYSSAADKRNTFMDAIEDAADSIAKEIVAAMTANGEIDETVTNVKKKEITTLILSGDYASLGNYKSYVDSAISAGTYNTVLADYIGAGTAEFTALVDARVEAEQETEYEKLLDKEIGAKLTQFGKDIVKEINIELGKAYEKLLADNSKFADEIAEKQLGVANIGQFTGEGGIYEGVYTDKNGKAILFLNNDGMAVEGTILREFLQAGYYDLKGQPK